MQSTICASLSQLLGERLSPNVLGFVILHQLPCLLSRVFFDSFIQNTQKVTEAVYGRYRFRYGWKKQN
ncbi:hypothetical protein FD723_07890 [Nostoc sp. C052]|nr:hypothetical protein FD723_07890 [Nostoc sp. C052]